MTDDSELQGLDPFDLMAIEGDRLSAYFDAIADEAWLESTRCEGWNVRDLLAHLAASEDYNRACIDGTVAAFLAQMGERGITSLDAANEAGVRDLDDVPTPELLDRWRARAAETREALRARDGGDIDSSVGSYPTRWQAFHLAFELAIHADDVGAPVDADEEPGRTAWLARFGRFALREYKPDVEIEATGSRTHVRGADVDVVLPDAVFVEAAAGRAESGGDLDANTLDYLRVT